jgi:hypothetical protein
MAGRTQCGPARQSKTTHSTTVTRMNLTTAMTIPTEHERERIATLCSVFGALGLVVAEILYEVLLGPHIRLVRTLSVGSMIGVVAGLLTATLQWLVLRRYVPGAGAWIVATTAGYTLAATMSSFLLYQAILETEQFTSVLPLQGVVSSGLSGLVLSVVQWVVLRRWVHPALGWRSWMVPLTLGNALAPPIAWLAGLGTGSLMTQLLGLGSWPVIALTGIIAAALAGAIVYGRFLAWGFHRVLPRPISATAVKWSAS